jgi:hypothetical protein
MLSRGCEEVSVTVKSPPTQIEEQCKRLVVW